MLYGGDYLEKRVVALFSFFMLSIFAMMLSVYSISQNNNYWISEAVSKQGTYKLKVADFRGTIYDCRNNPLTGTEKTNIAAVIPNNDTINYMSSCLQPYQSKQLYKLMKNGKPFIFPISQRIKTTQGIDVFQVPKRYSHNQLAPHIIGYLNGSGEGVCGIEKSYDDYLSNTGASICIKYKVDALDRVLSGENRRIDDTSYLKTKGVVLTIDKQMQNIVQNAAKRYMNTGAILVVEVPSCKIRASVSMPGFSPDNISYCLKLENSPLLNRILCRYDVGSVFKLVTSAAALESEINTNLKYDCTGQIDIEGKTFHCFNNKAHGTIDIKDAVAQSCNTYFINLCKKIDPNVLLETAKKFGFGKSYNLAPGIFSNEGILPSQEALQNKRALSMLSFGQGELMATPVQIATMINTIASNGMYSEPTLVEGLINENFEYVSKSKTENPKRIISEATAKKLKEYMLASVEYGTSKRGKPSNLSAGAKTSTAQTGMKINGQQVIQSWYAGFYPFDKPKYCIVVLVENGVGGGESCGPVSKKIMDDIYSEMRYSLS